MIGFNGTYLPAASHGNMRITAASIGGQLVITPWLTIATHQAIIAAFGAEEGTAVIKATNDYLNAIALTDTTRAQQLTNFINEDPLLVCSLVETSKVRGLVGDGTAYINALFMPKTDTRIVTQVRRIQQIDTWDFVYGAGMYTLSWRIYLCFYQNKYSIFGGGGNVNTSISCDEFHIIDETHTKTYIDGQLVANTTGKPTNAPCDMYIMAVNNNGSFNGRPVKAEFGIFKIYDGETQVRDFAPFQLGKDWSADKVSTGVVQSAGTNGMLDILSGTFYPNANTEGTFTIAITDKA